MRAKSTVNGFSAWNTKQRTTSPLIRWAGTQAHFLLHAHLMSPILSACHILFRNTGLTPRRCAPERDFHILPNLKTKTVMKKTKIVCTIGPKTESEEMLSKMLDAGMNVMRLNFSHGDYAEHGQRIQNLRNVMSKTGKKRQSCSTPKVLKSAPSNWKAVTTFPESGPDLHLHHRQIRCR